MGSGQRRKTLGKDKGGESELGVMRVCVESGVEAVRWFGKEEIKKEVVNAR